MVDSVAVFPPGFRVLDSDGAPVNNAKIIFREAGGGSFKDVFSDKDLTDPANNLGATIRTNAGGFPVVSFGSDTTCLIYTDADPYHITITDADDVTLFPAKDNVRGALDTSDFVTSDAISTLSIPVLAKSVSYTVLAADKGKLIDANADGGSLVISLPSAITVGDGWNIGIRSGGVNALGIVSIDASQAIAVPMGSVSGFSLRPGESVWLISNGATWKTSNYVPPRITGTTGIILIAERVAAAPVATPAARFIATGTFVAGAITANDGDIIEADGQGGWFKITPFADCGWVAYVQNDNAFFTFPPTGTTWVQSDSSDTVAGRMRTATAAEMEAAASLVAAVTPGRQVRHPAHPKAWALVTVSGGTPTLAGGHNVAGITDTGVGRLGITIDTDFSSTSWCAVASGEAAGANSMHIIGALTSSRTAGAIELDAISDDGALEDPVSWSFIGMGDQA